MKIPAIGLSLAKTLFLTVACCTWTGNANGQRVTLTDHAPVIQADAYQEVEPQFVGLQSVAQQDVTPQAVDTDAQKAKEAEEAAKKAKAALQKKVAGAYKPLFYDNDFSYLCDPDYEGWHLGEGFKKLCFPAANSLDIGGQIRIRPQFESNIRGLGLTGVDDDFVLSRLRLYGDLKINQNVRVYAEMIDAQSNYENVPARGIEENRTDMLNLFVDTRLLASGDRDLSLRVGRQELLFGAQRVVSPLDWANTRRTFEGARVTLKNKKASIDGFWTNPVRINRQSFDSPNRDQEFMGVYSSFKIAEKQTFDAYFLRFINGAGRNNFKFNTIGVRSKGNNCGLLWDFEADYQFGSNTDGSDHAAGAVTMGIGRELANRCWKPTVWAYYDYASGDNDLGAGNGYHHNFPLAHKYLGFMDLYGRRNIEDLNMLVTMNPNKRLKLLAWYHYFFLATQSDSPYSVAMTPFNGANLPGSPDLGSEIDLIADYKINVRTGLLFGYSHFFAGRYYSTTANVPYDGDADFFYTQLTFNF